MTGRPPKRGVIQSITVRMGTTNCECRSNSRSYAAMHRQALVSHFAGLVCEAVPNRAALDATACTLLR
jgi:hypothetical protein